MSQRLNYPHLAPEPIKALMGVEQYLHGAVEPKLLHMLKLRASQLNGCAYCIDMHWKDAKAAGETEERLYMLSAWRESPLYTDKERAALAWAESLTNIADGHAPDALFSALRPHFDDKQIVDLTWALASINAWNRAAIAMRAVPGVYRPAKHAG